MSRNWSWDEKDDLRVMNWAINSAKDSLTEDDSWTASVILTGVGNLLALKSMLLPITSKRIDDWIWEIHAGIYDGILYPGLENIDGDRSVLGCLRLLNSFFALNHLHEHVVSANTPDLIIPEPYEDDGIIE
jgi:hypothetical protein